MSKVTLKVEIDEEVYKQIKDDSVCSNNNECIISKTSSAYYALNAIINATPITESDDAVSKQVVKEQMLKYGFHAPDMTVTEFVEDLPPVIPKREQGEYDEDYRTLQIKLENAEFTIENLKEDLRQAREDLRYAEMR